MHMHDNLSSASHSHQHPTVILVLLTINNCDGSDPPDRSTNTLWYYSGIVAATIIMINSLKNDPHNHRKTIPMIIDTLSTAVSSLLPLPLSSVTTINNNGNNNQTISMIAAIKEKTISTIAPTKCNSKRLPRSLYDASSFLLPRSLLRPYNKAVFCDPATKQFSVVAPSHVTMHDLVFMTINQQMTSSTLMNTTVPASIAARPNYCLHGK